MSNSKVLIIHRQYRNRGGEESFLDEILKPALSTAGLEFECLTLPPLGLSLFSLKDFLEVFGMITGFEGIRPSLRSCLNAFDRGGFSHVLFNNFLPTISLRVPSLAQRRGLRTFMWVHNFRIDCANGLHFDGKNICHQCLNSGSRWSFFLNCQRGWIQSFIYALTYRGRRVAKLVIPFINHFICNSEFTRASLREVLNRLSLKGSSSVISMPVPRAVAVTDIPSDRISTMTQGPFYLFLGRVSFEKGADRFLRLAQKFPDRGFLMCGEGPMLEELKRVAVEKKIENLAFGGLVGNEEKRWLFKNCEAIIVPSRTPETSSLVISESQPYGTPVVYPTGGGAEETFKFLGRTGCPLNEFVGQTFKREPSGIKNFYLEDFAAFLKEGLLGSL